jgi:hypothetical protein
VLAIPVNQRVIAQGPGLGREARADELVASLSGRSWRTRSAGAGAKGDRRYAWARARINGGNDPEAEHWLLARRSLADKEETAYWICHGPKRVGLAELVRVAGARWAIEETFQTAKGETGLEHYQVRQWTGWYRHITLSMLAHAFLTVTRSKGGRSRRWKRADRLVPARDQAPSHEPDLGMDALPGPHPELIHLAPTTPTTGQTPPLPGPRPQPTNATVVPATVRVIAAESAPAAKKTAHAMKPAGVTSRKLLGSASPLPRSPLVTQ